MDTTSAQQIKKILTDKFQENYLIFSYGDEKHFKQLWEIGKNTIEGQNILVIWDGFPNNPSDNPVSLEQFVTPIDWALAYLIQYHNTQKSIPNIVILDLFSHNYNNYGEGMKKWHQNVLGEMKKWLQFYSFNTKAFGGAASSPLDIKNYLANQSVKRPPKDKPQGLSVLSEKWFQNIKYIAEEARGNHSINNIMGSMVIKMLMNIEVTGGYLYEKAFHQNFIWHGWIIPEEDRPDVSLPKIEIDDSTRIILIDDLGEYGWLDILSWWFLGGTSQSRTLPDLPGYKIRSNNNKKLYSTTDEGDYGYVSPIINRLEETIQKIKTELKNIEKEKIIKRKWRENNVRYRLSFTRENEQEIDEILFFDLYLFPKNESKENKYFEDVVALATDIRDNIDKNLLVESQKILSSDVTKLLSDVKKFLEDCNNNCPISEYFHNNYMDCLTLLPRLIALIDPTIPIILFSSSEKDRSSDPIKNYKNIYRYHKPVLLSKISRSRSSFSPLKLNNVRGNMEGLIEEIKSKIKSIKVRRSLRILSKHASYNILASKDALEQEIILAIDETGHPGVDEKFTIGGWYGSKNIADTDVQGDNKQQSRQNWPVCVNGITQAGKKIYAIKLIADNLPRDDKRLIKNLIEIVKIRSRTDLKSQTKHEFRIVLNTIKIYYESYQRNPLGCLSSGSFEKNFVSRAIEQSRVKGYSVAEFHDDFDETLTKVKRRYIRPISEAVYKNVQLHRDMLNKLLELFMHVLLPAHKAENIKCVHIHVGTCQRPCYKAINSNMPTELILGTISRKEDKYKDNPRHTIKVIKKENLDIHYASLNKKYSSNLVFEVVYLREGGRRKV